ncbi:MAG TPA: hypothetical protein ENI73_00880, partial [Spirochaetes bacterium]|nr:hypothetical protein [Spirochaetota bacterium]
MELNNLYGLINRGVQKYNHLPAMVHKSKGQWARISWDELKTKVHQIAQGLIELGLNKSNTVCLLSNTRVEWSMIDLGILADGGITVPIYPSSVASQCEFIINDSEARFIFVENEEQLKKVLEIRARTPNLIKIITITEGIPGSNLVLTLE